MSRRTRKNEAAAPIEEGVETGLAAPAPEAQTQLAPLGNVVKPAPKGRASRLPRPIQFPLVVILSFSMASLSYSFLNERTNGELATTARPLTNQDVTILAAWRIAELALGWYGDFDSYDLAALNLLSHGPTHYLLATFYALSPTTALTSLAIEVVSAALPFVLVRPLSGAHSAAATIPNREIITDRSLLAVTSILSGLIYSTALYISLKTYLPDTLVLYFEGIPSVLPAVDATFGGTVVASALALPFGLAARTFIFTPFAATGTTPADVDLVKFDPVSASLGETVQYNLWGFTARTKVIIGRTLTLALVTGLNTWLQTSLTVNGVSGYGAAVYAFGWVIAASVTGIALGLVGEA